MSVFDFGPSCERLPPFGAVIGYVHAEGVTWPVTASDALWLARAVRGEVGPGNEEQQAAEARAIASTMVRRMAWVRSNGAPVFDGLTELVRGSEDNPRGYSTPVSIYREVMGDADTVQRRARIRGLRWDQIEPHLRCPVLNVLTGETSLTAHPATHFGSWSLYLDSRPSSLRERRELLTQAVPARRGEMYVPVPELSAGANVFSGWDSDRGRKDPKVTSARPGRRVAWVVTLGAAAAGALAAGVTR